MSGRAGEAADTELKTKTPHVNVGKKLLVYRSWQFQKFKIRVNQVCQLETLKLGSLHRRLILFSFADLKK